MATNPNNNLNLRGTVISEPFYTKRKSDGVEFACSFILGVQRNYRNKGVYLSDQILCQMENEERMQLCHQYLQKGVEISLVGALRTVVDEQGHYSMHVLTESFTATASKPSLYDVDIDINQLPFSK